MPRLPKNLKIFVIYFNLHLTKIIKYKTFINSKNKAHALNSFFKKMGRDYKGFTCSSIRIFEINPNNYKGNYLTDKQLDKILYYSYPNTKHKLRLFPPKIWFKKRSSKNRDSNGRFVKGNTPWNKNLKIKFYRKNENGLFKKCRDSLGRFKPGIKPITHGHAHAKPLRTNKQI